MNLENRKAGEREDRPTPETDDAARKGAYMDHGAYPETSGKQIVHIEFARRLERERDAARRERDRLLAALKALIDAPDYRKLSEFSQQELAAWAEARQAVAAVEVSAS